MNERENKLLLNEFVTKRITLKNRFVMAPVPTGFVKDRKPTSENVKFYGERAKSLGLIIAGAINIDHETAPNHEKTPNISKSELEAWKNITDEVHRNNGKIVAQIWHSGGYRKFCLTNGTVTTPSGIVCGKKISNAMTRAEIATIVSKFAEAAFYVKKAGFDGLEIHGAHGGLIHDFFCSKTNLRTDEYGISNRTLFVEEIIRECKKTIGDSFPLLLRISNFKMYDFGAQLAKCPEEYKKFILTISNAGVDIFDCSAIRFTDCAFTGYDGSLAYWTKKITGKPTINVGCVGSSRPFLNDAYNIIEIIDNGRLSDKFASYRKDKLLNSEVLYSNIKNGNFDLIAVGRPLIFDSRWAEDL